jgi:hypothetical protein
MGIESDGKDSKPMIVVALTDMCTHFKEQRKMSAYARK